MKIKTLNSIDVSEFDALVMKTYGRTYSFQQQDGCKERGVVNFTVPNANPDDFENDSIPEEVNGDDMGVSFKAWLTRDPEQKLNTDDEWARDNGLSLFWERNFYPSLDMVTQDLYQRGLIPAGKYQIIIDW